MRTYQAYIVVWSIEKDGPTSDAGIYGEPYPTSDGNRRRYPKPLHVAESKVSFERAYEVAKRIATVSYSHLLEYPSMKRSFK